MKREFPQGFLWGAATAAHQVEGRLRNTWTEWETANADRLAAKAESQFGHASPVWSDVKPEAQDPANYVSGRAADHYHRIDEDIQLMKQLNLSAYRFTIDWSRVEPKEGEFDQAALDHYRSLVIRLKKANIEPLVTLWHWPLPIWLGDRGGWLAPDAVDRFQRFTQQVVETLGNDVQYWITLNEPNVYASHSYLLGLWPPAHRNPLEHHQILHTLQTAHRAAYRFIKEQIPTAQVGLAHHVTDFVSNSNPLNLVLRWWANRTWNWSFLDGIRDELDFIGVNNYFRRSFGNTSEVNLGTSTSEVKEIERVRKSNLGWDLEPKSLAGAVTATWQRYHKPIIVTEHGLADRADQHRAWFIEESLKYLHEAIQAGTDVRGYLHWSLLDNFEWDKGFWPRFGLVAVDYTTQKRTIRPSARTYAHIAKTNTLEI